MKRKYLESTTLGLLLLGLAVYVGYLFMSGTQSFSTEGKNYSTDLNELRARFNQDTGKVRLLLLLSPT